MASQLSGVHVSEHRASRVRSGRIDRIDEETSPTMAMYAVGPGQALAMRTAAWTSGVTARVQNLFVW
jgi:hypothetical protein